MLYYICSSNRCAVKINGEFVGYADLNLKTTTAPKDAFFEFIPTDNYLGKATLSANNLNQNSAPVKAYPYESGFLILPIFYNKFIPFYKQLYKNIINDCFVQVYIDGYCKVVVANDNGSEIFHLPFIPTKIQAKKCDDFLFVQFLTNRKSSVYIFNIKNAPLLHLVGNANSFQFLNGGFCLTQRFKRITEIAVTKTYDKNGELLQVNHTRNSPIERLNANLIPYAFLDELNLCESYLDFLSPNLLQHKQLIKDFFGNLLTYIPINSNNQLKAIIIEEDRLRTLAFSLENNRICDFLFE
ncbi:MAG: hypothetical protein IKT32_05290 [Clostridia bacterium]|nr:hypothetical protein [Clostridia bacterium]